MNLTEINKKIGDRMRQIRHEKGMTQEQVAAELNVEGITYARLEKGKTDGWSKYIFQLAEMWEVEVDEFFKFGDNIVQISKGQNGGAANAVVINQLSQQMKEVYDERVEDLKEENALLRAENQKLRDRLLDMIGK